MRVSVTIASCLAWVCLGLVQAQSDANTTQPLVFNPADVVQEIIMGDSSNDQPQLRQVADGATTSSFPEMPEIRNGFVDSISVHRPFDTLTVTTPDVGPINVVKVKSGKVELIPGCLKCAVTSLPKIGYIYGEFMVLRVRSIGNELVQLLRAPPDQAVQQNLMLTHTMSNTKVSSQSTTQGWDAEATVTARAEALGGFSALNASVSAEVSATVRRAVSTTYASSQESTITVTNEKSFTLIAPKGRTVALWMSTVRLDVFVCKASTQATTTNPIDGTCHFSHSVKEEGKRYMVTKIDANLSGPRQLTELPLVD